MELLIQNHPLFSEPWGDGRRCVPFILADVPHCVSIVCVDVACTRPVPWYFELRISFGAMLCNVVQILAVFCNIVPIVQ